MVIRTFGFLSLGTESGNFPCLGTWPLCPFKKGAPLPPYPIPQGWKIFLILLMEVLILLVSHLSVIFYSRISQHKGLLVGFLACPSP